MLAFVPVTFTVYRTVRRHLHWTLQNLIGFADRSGRCFPSLRALVKATGRPLSTVGRHLAQLAADGIITRQRRPGGGYTYRIDARFLPAMRGESHLREKPVPPVKTEEQVAKKTGYAQARFAQSGTKDSAGLPDMTDQWRARIGSWARSGGKFWLDAWGPKPSEPGCFAPPDLLQLPTR